MKEHRLSSLGAQRSFTPLLLLLLAIPKSAALEIRWVHRPEARVPSVLWRV